MINIAFLIPTISTDKAGTEKQLLYLLKELDRKRFNPYLICMRKSEWLQKNITPCPTIILNITSLLSFNTIRSFRFMKNFYLENNIHIVQTFFPEGDLFGIIISKICNVKKIIASRRNIGKGYWHTFSWRILLRIISIFIDYYLANSNAAAKETSEIEWVSNKKIKIINNGIELHKFDYIKPDKKIVYRNNYSLTNRDIVIGTIANLRPIKNIDVIIKAAAILANENNNYKFFVFGEGQERIRLERMIHNLRLTDTFFLPGVSVDILETLAIFDIAVLSSFSESFSNSLLEYMAFGLPVIATNVGGNVEVIENGKTGLLFNPYHPDKLVQAIKKIANNNILAQELGNKARKKIFDNFDISKMISNTQNFYYSILEK